MEENLSKDQRYRRRLSEEKRAASAVASAARVAKWRQANPDLVVQANAASYAFHRERIAERRKENPVPRRVADANRRARKAVAGGSHTAADVLDLLAKQKGLCAACGERLSGNRQVDHIVPIARGGSNSKTNLQILCKPCNLAKGAKDPIAFAQSRGRLC